MAFGNSPLYDQKQLTQVARKYRLKFVILHGSYATGKIRPRSDLDIAAFSKRPLGFRDELKLHGEMADILGNRPERELDFKLLNRVDPFFRYQVLRDCVLLFGNPTGYEEFKLFALRAYDDAQPLLKLDRLLARKYQRHLNKIVPRYA